MKTRLFHLLSIALVSVACHGPVAQSFSVIPEPAKVELNDGVFNLSGADFIVPASMDSMTRSAVNAFASHLKLVTGRTNRIRPSGGAVES